MKGAFPRAVAHAFAALALVYPMPAATLGMIGSRSTVAAIRNREDPLAIVRGWSSALQSLLELRQKYLIYPADTPRPALDAGSGS